MQVVPYEKTPWACRAMSTLYWLWCCKNEPAMFAVFKDLADRIAHDVYDNWKVQDVCWGNEYTCQPFEGSPRVFKWNSRWSGGWEMLKHPVLYIKCPKCLRPATAQLFSTHQPIVSLVWL